MAVKITTCSQNAARLSRPLSNGGGRNVLKKAYRSHPTKKIRAGMPFETRIVQNVPWVPTEGPGGAFGKITFRDTGAPKPRIGCWVISESDELYRIWRCSSPYPPLSLVRT